MGGIPVNLARRDEYEQDLARVVARTLRQQFNKFMAVLGDNPSLDKLTPALYEESHKALQAVIRPILEKVYLEHAEALTHEFPQLVKQRGVGIDWGLVNERAAEWAGQYSFELVTGITNTTRKTLQRQISDFFRDERTLKDLRATLSKLFGPVRADMIAQTEVTRAASAAETMYEHELNKMGLQTTQVWQTNNDEIAQRCPICWPRHETRRGDGWDEPPPGHPRCRCWTNTVVLDTMSVKFANIVKAATSPEGYAVLYLDNVQGLLDAQAHAVKIAQEKGVGFDPVPRDELHITLVYAEHVTDETLNGVVEAVKKAEFSGAKLTTSSTEWFGEDQDKRALVYRVEDAKLSEFQKAIYGYFLKHDVGGGKNLSEFSLPQNWKPHVTIGYGPEFEFNSEVVEFEVNRFAVTRDDYQDVAEVVVNHA